MRKITREQTAVRQYTLDQVQSMQVPAPIGGWNARDPLALMDPKYAPILDNWVPRTGYVEIRPGYSAWAQALGNGAVESLMTYRPAGPITNEKLFAACAGSIFDVSISGTITAVQTSLISNRWQHVNFTPSGGANYLYIVNGQDAPRAWNGTSWILPAITGVTASTLINVAVWKRRLWFVQANSTVAWFLGTDAIQGAATALDIGALITKGGSLLAIGSLTVDGGNGPDDLLVLVTTRGEVVIYKGIDPTNANAFSLVGVFALPPPLGSRCLMDYGADLAIITLQGVIPLSQALPLDSDAVASVAITNTIQNAMLQAAGIGENNFGWELSHFPAQGLFLLNVPLSTNVQQVQFAQNAITGAWCRFTGWNANCFTLFQDQLYFGDNSGNVNLAWSGSLDLISPIVYDMQCAFNYFGAPGRIKQMTMIQPLLVTSGLIIPVLSVDVDFGNVSPTANVAVLTPAGAKYDISLYDSSTYAAGPAPQGLWDDVQAQGHALAIRMKITLSNTGAGPSSVFDTGVFDTMVFDGAGTGTNTLQIFAFNSLVKFGGTI